MKKRVIVEIAEGLGNQLFMYAHAYSVSRKLDYDLLIDNRSGYSIKKNILRKHQKYMLDSFNIIENYAPNNFIFDTKFKKLKKKLLIFLNKFYHKKIFIKERTTKINNLKIPKNYTNLLNDSFSNNIYIQGNFENYKYFNNYQKELSRFFVPKNNLIDHNEETIKKLTSSNSISIHIRRNRFSDQIGLTDTFKNQEKSDFFTERIINYTNKSINYINSNVSKPEYFIWTNDHNNIDDLLSKIKVKNYTLINNDVINDFNLFRYCKHFIVGPSSFHWWGAWLNSNPNKICTRPIDINPSNNENFWPKEWLPI